MARVVVRVWVPDRPGALGLVASRIGAVRGEILGIEVLERGAGRAIDELVVDLPDVGLTGLLVDEVNAVDGVDVEDVRPATASLDDPRVDALQTAALLVAADTPEEVLTLLVEHARLGLEAEWAAVVDGSVPVLTAAQGPTPPVEWMAAFLEGGRSSARVSAGETGPDDVAWAALRGARLDLVLGRGGRPLRARERHQLGALASIADLRWRQVSPGSVASSKELGVGPSQRLSR